LFALARSGVGVHGRWMRGRPSRSGLAGTLTGLAIAAVALLVLAPNLVAEGLGRLVAHVWVTTMAAIAALLGGLFGGG
jgi:hypothetical protein